MRWTPHFRSWLGLNTLAVARVGFRKRRRGIDPLPSTGSRLDRQRRNIETGHTPQHGQPHRRAE